MKKNYSLCSEINNNGQYNSDKNFSTPELANKYLRKLAAKTILYLRENEFEIRYVNVYKFDKNDISFPATIEIGGFNYALGWMRYDIRVKTSVLFEYEKEFNTFPIQI
jgi:hypothetical protein